MKKKAKYQEPGNASLEKTPDLIEELGFHPKKENLVFLSRTVEGGGEQKLKGLELCEKEVVGDSSPNETEPWDTSWKEG